MSWIDKLHVNDKLIELKRNSGIRRQNPPELTNFICFIQGDEDIEAEAYLINKPNRV